MRIGEVHALLRRDHPDIELSKIRYYEDKGLVQPSRSRKGYRLYSERDVACLREAIRLANEEFVPLRVVRVRLIEQGLLTDEPIAVSNRHAARSASNVISIPVPAVSAPSNEPRSAVPTPISAAPVLRESDDLSYDNFFTTSEFLRISELEASAVNQLIALGLIVPITVANETAFTGFDVRIARAASPLVERGADIRLLGSLRRVVEREVGILEDLTQPVRTRASGGSADEAQRLVGEVASELTALRSELFARALRDYLGH
ncbi:MAG: MerR family transcriptional regulator [Acidobacteria bacterium]|nr:MerR family transcriptional regulator [Acidobacteriota bacterium]